MKKMIIVSPETHSSLFLIKGNIQRKKGHNITLNEVMRLLISHWNKSILERHERLLEWKLEEKE